MLPAPPDTRPFPWEMTLTVQSFSSTAAPVRVWDLLAVVALTAAVLYAARLMVGAVTVTPLGLVGLMLLAALAPIVAVWVVMVRLRGVAWADLGLRAASGRHLGWGVVLGLLTVPLAGLVNALVTSLTDGPFENPQIEVLAPTALSVPAMVGMLVLAAGVAPVVEEIVFRGVLYGWLRRFLSPAAGIVLSALVFGAVHGIPQLVPALAVQGVVLAMVYERTRSLWPSIVLHGVFNAVMLGALYGVTRATSVL